MENTKNAKKPFKVSMKGACSPSPSATVPCPDCDAFETVVTSPDSRQGPQPPQGGAGWGGHLALNLLLRGLSFSFKKTGSVTGSRCCQRQPAPLPSVTAPGSWQRSPGCPARAAASAPAAQGGSLRSTRRHRGIGHHGSTAPPPPAPSALCPAGGQPWGSLQRVNLHPRPLCHLPVPTPTFSLGVSDF